MLSFQDFSSLCVKHIKEQNVTNIAVENISPDEDLFSLGIIDSHSFMSLLLFIEEKTGVFIDITEHSLEDFSSIEKMFEITKNSQQVI